MGGHLGGEGIDLLDHRDAAAHLAGLAHGEGRRASGAVQQSGQLGVRVPTDLGVQPVVPGQGGEVAAGRAHTLAEAAACVVDGAQAVEEPPVDLSNAGDLIHSVALAEAGRESGEALVGGACQLRLQQRAAGGAVARAPVRDVAPVKPGAAAVHHAHGLLDALLKGAADGHDLPHRLHGGTNVGVHPAELLVVPPRQLHHAVVQGGFEAGGGGARDGVQYLRERGIQAQFGRHVREGVASSLGGQGGGARQARIYLDHGVVLRVRVHGVLDVALAHHAEVAHHADRDLPHTVVVPIRESLAGGHHDRLPGVDAERVQVLHVTHRHAVVVRVPHNLVLHLLPPLHGTLYKDLRGRRQRARGQQPEGGLVLADAGAQAAKSEGAPHHDGVANGLRRRRRRLHRVDGRGRGARDVNLP
mmetsp:Transcript_6523/g.18479  ORF Transcript_6523/g.18479 Transcript_6523/m.18479 type:complete len:415 (-) Transcript_6523:148-1392(-)